MSRLKKIAIVGRPNVGKSALFNAICKKRISIVDEREGITRDRLYQRTDLFGYPFEIIDTGGIEVQSKAEFSREIKRQAEIAIEEADSIIMVVDGSVGPQELDLEIAKILHQQKSKPLTLAVNKVDDLNQLSFLHRFGSLGISTMVAVSAVQSFQIAELIDAALRPFDRAALITESTDALPKIAILGRPNVGKSFLLNSMLGEERSIVSPIAGTTRDAIDTLVRFGEKEYLLIDTAGIRRKHKEKESVEKFASIRAEQALKRCDIALLIMDATSGMTTEEKKIANMIAEADKGCILLFNKWDLNQGFRMEHCLRGIEQEVPFLSHCPRLFISAKTRRNLDKIFPLVKQVEEAYDRRITTHTLNKCLISAMQKYHPPMIKGKRLRIYYLAQIDVRPPKFVLFVNSHTLMDESYKKYLINQIRETFDFSGVPIILQLRSKAKHKERRRPGAADTRFPHSRRPLDRDLPILNNDDDAEVEEEEFS